MVIRSTAESGTLAARLPKIQNWRIVKVIPIAEIYVPNLRSSLESCLWNGRSAGTLDLKDGIFYNRYSLVCGFIFDFSTQGRASLSEVRSLLALKLASLPLSLSL